jgi:hypothetical protein
MSQLRETVAGSTAPMEWDLKNDGASFDAQGMDPSAVLRDKDGNVVTFAGTVEWANAALSRIRYSPADSDLDDAKSPYTLHLTVTDGLNKKAFYPDGQPITLVVYPS